MFLKAINCEGKVKDKFFISNLLIKSIREIGPQNVVQGITDNAPVCKAAGLLVESIFPHIFWTPCVVHSLNLALKRIFSPSTHLRFYSDQWLEEVPGVLLHTKTLRLQRKEKKCLQRYFPNDSERRQVSEEYADFASCYADFSGSDSMNDRSLMGPVKLWINHGASTPTLQSMALKLLGQPCPSSCCERNWRTYNFIHSVKRNKITPQRAEDLVFVHNNLRLLSRRSQTYNEGVSHLWDVRGDGFDSMDMENAGILKIANLSLDEPELEAKLFRSVDNVNDDE
ncbi:hypothetical protein Dsin_030377 [Dipteronia sinensis]|uniref:HAT C-terminal dimerisation domain-containing protein n=1 Tax=Dipteronia sinensis TaxID=43782 RepID=A0AAE0DQZ5_9ROSI|nr:hypothetical protein Dsin_030377 [Dipteronia sinensis]